MALFEIRKLGDSVLLMRPEPVLREEVPGLIPSIKKIYELIQHEYDQLKVILALSKITDINLRMLKWVER